MEPPIFGPGSNDPAALVVESCRDRRRHAIPAMFPLCELFVPERCTVKSVGGEGALRKNRGEERSPPHADLGLLYRKFAFFRGLSDVALLRQLTKTSACQGHSCL